MHEIELYQNNTANLDNYSVITANKLFDSAQPNLQPAGIGKLLSAAIPIITLMLKLKNSSAPADIEQVYQFSANEIRAFEKFLHQAGYAPKTTSTACYCLCTAFDEMILNTSWGEQSCWVQQTLLSNLYKETWGGERFYVILNNMAGNPVNNLDILELIYVLLNLGFEGKYFHQDKEIRNEIRHSLFNLIRNYRETPKTNLSPTPTDKRVQLYHTQKKLSIKKLSLIISSALLVIIIGLNFAMYFNLSPLLNTMHNLTETRG